MFKDLKIKWKTQKKSKNEPTLGEWVEVNINPSPGQLWGEFAAVMEIVKIGLTKIRMSQ